MYRDLDEDISFGDIFEGEHFIDVYAAGDTRPLGGGPMPREAAERLAKQVNRPVLDPEGELLAVYSPAFELADTDSSAIPVFSPAIDQHADKRHALAHGSNMKLEAPTRAILLTDSCAADTLLVAGGRSGRRKRGRLLFAPVVPAKANDVERLMEVPLFGRFPLPACAYFEEGAIAELRYCFNVDVSEVDAGDRILALDDETAEELEVAWAAQTLRRGPLATERNVDRLAGRLTAAGHGDVENTAEAIGEVANVAWRLESELDAVSDAATELAPEMIEALDAVLHRLEEAARQARERLPRGDG